MRPLVLVGGLAVVLVAAAAAAGGAVAASRAAGARAAAAAATAAAPADAPRARMLATIESELPCCVPLGSNMQLRYAKPAPGGDFDFALAGALPGRAWMAFGPADPTATNRLMGSADSAVGGISDLDGAPWASDFFMSGYAPCDTTEPASGVCPDSALNSNPKTGARLFKSADEAKALDSVRLLSGGREGGVTTLRLRRRLAAADVLDHAIQPGKPANFIWAHGPLSPTDLSARVHPSLRLRQHGASRDAYGALTGLDLGACPTACPKLVPSTDPDSPPPAPAPAAVAAAGGAQEATLGGGARVSWAPKAGAGGAAGAAVSFRALKKSQWASLAVGTGMVGARAYVVWRDGGGLRSGVFNLTSYKASGVVPLPPPPAGGAAAAPFGGVSSMAAGPDGALSFEAWVPLAKGAGSLQLLWALGDGWALPVPAAAKHFEQSDGPTEIKVGPPPPPAAPAPPPPPPRPAVAVGPGCALKQAFELARLGDGWCDAGAPYNTADCAFDGGDCCNTALPLFDCQDPKSPNFGKASPRGPRFPAPRNPRYTAGLGRELSTEQLVTTWNNFYEFTMQKNVFEAVTPEARKAMELSNPGFGGWEVEVDGLVGKPMKADVRQLLGMVHIEERVYRHRCVETWAIVVPWEGFPLRKLLSLVNPLPAAKFIRFETDARDYLPAVQQSSAFGGKSEWPYVEGLSLEEGWNDLAFLSVGAFNTTLTAQSGAPLRLNVPWKYGFKSIKSIRRISLVAEQPLTYWSNMAPKEYGFWANINPAVPHPRWSQAQEQLLVTSPRPAGIVRTLAFNNYSGEVAHMYPNADKEGRTYFF
ncbi:hypothetical protein Rsub_09428 [Raphidocelis subcapitata]|uniref:DOMON domain-containing protein n=1 Tax=Raphidocelis subcapitata TaxID=307507 RepID=A0A2V0PGN1_9CHLO|nr:hypothetical protein Rsub_09428 [Raphidocelis subcapitata]|eukprot:GBF96357.1 hypothetical protein Rsub_09428 [Raphidocelis subcapitata]